MRDNKINIKHCLQKLNVSLSISKRGIQNNKCI